MTDQKKIENKKPLRNTHKTPFVWQAMATMGLIRRTFHGERLTTAVAIYQAFTECASEHGRLIKKPTAVFYVSLSRVAGKSGKSVSTIKRYANEFRRIRILDWKVRKQGKENKVNMWGLLATPVRNSEPPSIHNSELNTLAHNSELGMKEVEERFIYKKDQSKDWKTTNGMTSIGEIIERRPKF